MSGPTFPEPASYDWPARVADLNALLRLKTTITGMNLFERAGLVSVYKAQAPS